MIKVMIIEDEPQINKLLAKIVEREEGFEVVAQAESFAEAVTMFTKYRPEVAFVDVDLKGENGMECAKVMLNIDPKVKIIFATAHSEYMAGAFEIYAFDYIVKPFDIERVQRTLRRIREGAQQTDAAHSQTVIKETDQDRLLIKGKDRMDFIDKDEIIFAERIDNSTDIHTVSGLYKTSASLADLEQKLTAPGFMRCHKSYIINISMITKIEPYGRWTYTVKFKGTENTALITAEKYNELKEMFGV